MRNYALIGVSASDWETMENKISKAKKKKDEIEIVLRFNHVNNE